MMDEDEETAKRLQDQKRELRHRRKLMTQVKHPSGPCLDGMPYREGNVLSRFCCPNTRRAVFVVHDAKCLPPYFSTGDTFAFFFRNFRL